MKNLRIVFMGTPDFAVGILQYLHSQKCNIVAVITAPDKPAGRGQKVHFSAVKKYALENQLPLWQPSNLKNSEFLQQLQALNPDVQIVVAFRMLPEAVWKIPKHGTFNLHASLLPNYRGAAPINWAIINGETQTGVTTFFIDDKIDTGAIILQKTIQIQPTDTAGTLHDKLMYLGQTAVYETLEQIAQNKVQLQAQDTLSDYKLAYKLTKENCQIDFTQPGPNIVNLIRGLSPYPVAWCYFYSETEQWNVKIYEAQFQETPHNQTPLTVVVDKKELKIALKDGYLNILSLQFPGKKQLKTTDFLNGIQFTSPIAVK